MSRYHLGLGATAACTKILMEETKELGQRALKGSTRDFYCSEVGSLQIKQQRQMNTLVLI